MKRFLTLTTILVLFSAQSWSQLPLYYKIKKIEGKIYDEKGTEVTVSFKSRMKLVIQNCANQELDTFLRTLTIAKHGRKELEHLLTTSAKITIVISDKIGVDFRDGKYWLIAGITGPDADQSDRLIPNPASVTIWSRLFNKNKFTSVLQENRIELFQGSVLFAHDSMITLDKNNVKIFDRQNNLEITNFSMDTIDLEPILHPELLYKNLRELYYFGGLHEIYHTRPENIEITIAKGDTEYDTMKLERKAFKRRAKINK